MAVLLNVVTDPLVVLDSREMLLDAVPWVLDVASSATKFVRAMLAAA
jgi:hypothetical protein